MEKVKRITPHSRGVGYLTTYDYLLPDVYNLYSKLEEGKDLPDVLLNFPKVHTLGGNLYASIWIKGNYIWPSY